MTTLQFKVLNFVLFQLIWVAAVVYQNQGLWVCFVLLVLHFILSPARNTDIRRSYKAIILGLLTDSVLVMSGVFIFQTGYIPLWLVCLWVGFTLTLRYSLNWLAHKPVIWQSLLGALGGTTSYLAGARLGAVEIGIPEIPAILLLLAIWGVLFPILVRLTNGAQEARYA